MKGPICGMVYIKEPLLLIEKSSPCSSRSQFVFYLNGPLPMSDGILPFMKWVECIIK